MEFPKYTPPRYTHVDERTSLIQRQRSLSEQPPDTATTEQGRKISSTSSGNSNPSRFSFDGMRKFFSHARDQHSYQTIPDGEDTIEITSPLHKQIYQEALIDDAATTATSWPPMSEESRGLLATADRTNAECWNEFHKLSSQKKTRNPALFLQQLEKNIVAYQQYASSREIAFQTALQKYIKNSNPSLTPSLMDFLEHSHDASINYLLRLQSEIERLEKLVDEINATTPPDLTFSASVETPASRERERERLLPDSLPSLRSKQLTETISSLQEKISIAINTYHTKMETDLSFLRQLVRANPNSSSLVTALIEKLQCTKTWLVDIQDHRQNNTETLHRIFQQHLNNLFKETEKADREFQLGHQSNPQEALAAFSKARMKLWEAAQSFKNFHQEYNSTTDYLEAVYGSEQMLKRIKEKFQKSVLVSW